MDTSAFSEAPELARLLEQRVVICVGAGGVGKTTVSAALALEAARRGKRTLCLTIDPARRLASALGLSVFPTQELTLNPAVLREGGVILAAPLTVMMLDPRTTFDELVAEGAAASATPGRILQHRVYDHLVKNLAGTSAYMACEKLLRVLDGGRYDLVVLDTPPAARALDFFDAPEKMSRILDSPATRALLSAFGSESDRPLKAGRLFQAGFRAALTGMERLTGGQLLREVAQLIVAMNHLLGGFGERAARVEKTLRDPGVSYVLVTSSERRTLSDAKDLALALARRSIAIGAVAVNRVVPEVARVEPAVAEEIRERAAGRDDLRGSDDTLLEMIREEVVRRSQQLERIVEMLVDARLFRRSLSGALSSPANVDVALIDERSAELSNPSALVELVSSMNWSSRELLASGELSSAVPAADHA